MKQVREKQISFSYMWNLKKIIQINLFIKHTDLKNEFMVMGIGEKGDVEGQTGSLGLTCTH